MNFKTQSMKMKTLRLTTHWTADQADTAIELIDLLRDAIWETYGDQITAMHLTNECHKQEQEKSRENQVEFEFVNDGYDIPF